MGRRQHEKCGAHRGLAASAKWLFFNEESGLFVRYYRGTNDHNIHFEEPRDSHAFVVFGLIWEHGRARTFGPG